MDKPIRAVPAMEKLLIVDDARDIRKLLRFTLSYGRFEMFEACDGKQALEVALRERPAIIILDVMMPALDGIEVCRKIRQHSPGYAPYIIMLTAKTQADDVEAGIKAGANFYMLKPFSPSRLIEILEGVRTGKLPAETVENPVNGFDLRVSDRMYPPDLKPNSSS